MVTHNRLHLSKCIKGKFEVGGPDFKKVCWRRLKLNDVQPLFILQILVLHTAFSGRCFDMRHGERKIVSPAQTHLLWSNYARKFN